MDAVNINEPTSDKTEPFMIDSESRADWYLCKLADIEAQKARVKAQNEKRLAELEADAAALRFQFEAQAQAWARAEATSRRRQSVTLPNGTFAFTAFKAGAKITDEGAALAHARETLPEMVTTETITTSREKFDKAAYLAHVEATGEVLPGVDTFPAGENFAVKFPDAGNGKKGKGKAADTEPEG